MFYVYKLADPRDGAPFYIGKGKGTRAWSHARAVRRGKSTGNAKKDARISEIIAAGMEPAVGIIAEYEDQADAFDHEIELIATLPGLLNILKGGQGWALSPEEAQARAAARATRLSERKVIEHEVYLKRWLTMASAWPHGCTFPNMKNGDELGAEFFRTVTELVGWKHAAA